jgi:hypothetical protein
LVAGTRVDFHNLAGTQFTPRVNFKYDFTPQTILRLSAGRGSEQRMYLPKASSILHQTERLIFFPTTEIFMVKA